ncbi:hypothetical protein [Jeongeupia naejangsanensis]|uniref:Uncharacterized protein n=1 Tax=Jeongeupia naejangsanensis TaxID=613195 RepID=A0ABS2BFN5_9NEIS|nr:hypothetical protein [Jeongeupia naejangsanensis]MBM3114265.1 hypothetical protein [Jeongeupia naejangsanensis]
MVEVQMDLLDNWSAWLRGLPMIEGRAPVLSMYLSPEEKAQRGMSCGRQRVDEDRAMRTEAVVSVMSPQLGKLLRHHHVRRVNPSRTVRELRLPYRDYMAHVKHAEEAFQMRWNDFEATDLKPLTPTKMIRYLSLNNSIPLRRATTQDRVVSHA